MMCFFKKKKEPFEPKVKYCTECGGLFKVYKMTKVEVIRRPAKVPRGHWFEPYLGHDYYCKHCKKT
jgi:hypothetical protein